MAPHFLTVLPVPLGRQLRFWPPARSLLRAAKAEPGCGHRRRRLLRSNSNPGFKFPFIPRSLAHSHCSVPHTHSRRSLRPPTRYLDDFLFLSRWIFNRSPADQSLATYAHNKKELRGISLFSPRKHCRTALALHPKQQINVTECGQNGNCEKASP